MLRRSALLRCARCRQSIIIPLCALPPCASAQKWRKAQWQLEQGRKGLGTLQKELGALMKAKAPAADTDALKARKAEAEAGLVALEASAAELSAARDAALDLVRGAAGARCLLARVSRARFYN